MKRIFPCLMVCLVLLASAFSSTMAQVSYPALLRNSKPNPEVTPPGDAFTPPFSGNAKANTPQIGEWTRTAGPDESIILTGVDFSKYSGNEEGKDTRFTVYGNGKKKDAKIHRIDGYKAIITLDKEMPRWSMYLIWPGNENGYGAPVAINKTDSWWIGPNKAIKGQTTSVFGRNLSEHNDTLKSHVYIKPANGAGQWVTTKKINPFKVDFVVPSNLNSGEYEVWTHNGHGGEYGWSGPLKLIIQDEPKWVSNIFNVKDYGAKGDGNTDDLTAIRNAITAARNTPGSTVYFPAGTYMVSNYLGMSSNTRWKGEGKDKTFIKCRSTFTSDNGFITGAPDVFEISDLTFDTNKNYRGRISNPYFWRYSKNLVLNNVRVNAQNYDVLDLHHTNYVYIRNSEIIGMVSFLGQGSQIFFDSSIFKLTNDTDMGLYSWGGTGISMTNTICQDYDNSNVNDGAGWGKGRFFTFMGLWGSNRYTYIGNNTTIDLTARPSPDVDQNSGEQFLWEGFMTQWKGSPTSTTSNTFTVATYHLNDNIRYATIVKGRGLGQSRRVISHNGGLITLEEPWNIIPDNNSVITIGPYADKTVVYNNYLDAKPRAVTNPDHIAAVGIEPYGGVIDFIADNNTLHQLRQGTGHFAVQDGPVTPTFFTLYSNNKYINCRTAIMNAQGVDNPANETTLLGTIYRKNVVQNTAYGIQQAGFGHDYPITDATMFEHNVFTGVPVGYYSIIKGIINQAFYNNSFRGTNQSDGYAYTIGAKIAIRGNKYTDFKSIYSGVSTEAVLEAPYHVIELFAKSDSSIIDSTFTLWNSGTALSNWNATSSSTWLTLTQSNGSILDEKTDGLISFKVNPKNLAKGIHRAYITVKSGNQTKIYSVILNMGEAAVPNPKAPTINLTSPSSGSNFTAPATITLNAEAADGDGTVTKVEFFKGSTKLGEDVTAPYSFDWSNVAVGNYTLTAKATDNSGLTTSSNIINITVNAPSQPLAPTINFTSPSTGSNFTAPATLTLNAEASDADGTVTKVEFFNGSTKLGEDVTAPYSFDWSNVAVGNYALTAKATDNSGLTTSSNTINITVKAPQPTAPTINFTSPSTGSNFTAPATLTLNAEASDADGTVTKVEFFNGSTKLGEDVTAPYSFDWSNVAVGNYALTAKATDNSGLTTSSEVIYVIVSPVGVIPVQPEIDITSPEDATVTFLTSITISATASDADGTINKVEFFAGNAKIGEAISAPYNFIWSGMAEGVYTLTAKATDNSGLSTTSQQVTLIVSKPVVPPTVHLISLTRGDFTAPANINLAAEANDADGSIKKVEFFSSGVKIGESTNAPYTLTWNNVAVGHYFITAKATDNAGLTSFSAVMMVTVSKPKVPPTIQIASPAKGSNFGGPANITITAEAVAVEASIVKVEFFNAGIKIGEDVSVPFEFIWKNVPIGGYKLSAKVTDSNGLTAISDDITISVIESNKLNIYPNPFKSVTTIEFSLTYEAYAELQIYNSLGSLVSTAYKGLVKANEVKQIPFEGTGLPSGIYFCRLIYNDGFSYFKHWLENKMVIIK